MVEDAALPARRGASGPRGRGRRTLADRERLQKEEEQRAKSHNLPSSGRGRGNAGGPRQGRGSGPGSGNWRNEQAPQNNLNTAVPIGPFSLGSVIDRSRRRNYYVQPGGGGGGGGDGESRGIGRSDNKPGAVNRVKVKREGGARVGRQSNSSDEESDSQASAGGDRDADDDGIQTVNVNNLFLAEQAVPKVEGAEPTSTGFFPVSIERKPHVDRRVQISAQAGAANVKKEVDSTWIGKRKPKFKPGPNGQRLWKGVYQDDDFESHDNDSADETADGDDDYEDDDDQLVEARHGMETLTYDNENTRESGILQGSRPLDKRRKSSMREQKPKVFQTDEDQKEWERWQEDQEHISQLLGGYVANLEVADVESAQEEIVKAREGMAVLLQFPPVLAGLKGKSKDAANTTASVTESTVEQATHSPTLESGYVGKLRVYKSGRAVLDWGGIPMELIKGLGTNHYQNVVYIPNPTATTTDEEEAAAAPPQRDAISLGTVKEKFVVTPKFDDLMARHSR